MPRPALSPIILTNMKPPTPSIAQPSPFSNTWWCQGDLSTSSAHTGHKTPKGGPNTGHPKMKEAN